MAEVTGGDARVAAAEFEREVRRIAALMYPDPSGGAVIADGRERDGVYVTEGDVVVIEATTSREKTKADSDGRKLLALCDRMRQEYPYHGIKGFFITAQEPTPHQREAIKKINGPRGPLIAMSFAAFRARAVNSAEYLSLRSRHPFGSARDPETDKADVQDRYVALDFVDATDRRTQYGLPALVEALGASRRAVLLGDYGAGKSMTLREVFLHFAREHRRDGTGRFCLHLNLSEHQGQTDPVEALHRHAQKITFPYPHHLVRAWKSGEAHILLDGFDEILLSGWTASSRTLAQKRFQSLQLVRNFVHETPEDAGILIAGREHFFDNLDELRASLGISRRPLIASATDFTEAQVAQYLAQRKWLTALPDWLPRRPLIVGYLASRQLFGMLGDLSSSDPGTGWDRLLTELSAREARQVGLDGEAVRLIIERLATLARKSSSGLGPLSFDDLINVFGDLQDYRHDEGTYSLLQRLPGLRVNDTQDNSRIFVDDDLVDACRAGDVFRWISHQGGTDVQAMYGWQNLMGPTGLAVAARRLAHEGRTAPLVQAAVERTHSRPELMGLRADLVRLLFGMDSAPAKPVTISDQDIPFIRVPEGVDASCVTFSGCLIGVLDLSDLEAADLLPTLDRCSIEVVDGVAGIDELATGRIQDCQFGTFTESAENAAAILRLDIPDYARVAMTVLNKIFKQSGRSRKENALYRGSLSSRQKQLIPGVLRNLERHGAIIRSKRHDTNLWAPNLAMSRRVQTILAAPTTTRDPLVWPER
jgi:hypothetical protein